MPINLYSTFYFDESGDCKKLFEDVMLSKVEQARDITILSAYYSISFLKSLFESVARSKRKECAIKLVFNGFAGNRLEKQKRELLQFINLLKKKGYSNIKIYLNTGTTLFHTKLYRFERKNKLTWFIGSANASEPAFNSNGDILLAIDRKVSEFERYVEKVINNSIEINKVCEPRIENLTSFWRTGLIYFKPNTQIPFTFNELNMDDDVKERLNLSATRPRNTNPGAAWGAYNIKRSLGLLDGGNEDDDDEEEKKNRVNNSRWSIETCYGYWVPAKYSFGLDEAIIAAGKSRKNDINGILQKLKIWGQGKLIQDYSDYLKDVSDILKENNIDWRPDMNLPKKFGHFLQNVITRIDSPEHVERASRPLISTGMPEIWSDTVATEDFSNSFFEYLEYKIRVSSNSLIVYSLKEALQLKTNVAAGTIKRELIKYLEEKGWSDDEWLDNLQR